MVAVAGWVAVVLKMYRCIGQKRVRLHESDKERLVRCANESDTPSNKERPEWGFICKECIESPPVQHSPMVERFEANATQNEASEYKDQMESGVMIGIRGSFPDGDGESD